MTDLSDKFELNQEEALLDAIRYMAILAEYHIPEIVYHLERVSAFSQILAMGLGIPEEEARLISVASQLHDIGMIGVPEAITQKKGQPTHEEWEIIKMHPRLGADLLVSSQHSVFKIGEIICLTHHERWDGSGYPRSLKEDQIPIEGRICGVADVFDTMTTRKIYQNEVSPEHAMHLIEEASGVFFDPDVVKVLKENFEEILRIQRKSVLHQENRLFTPSW